MSTHTQDAAIPYLADFIQLEWIKLSLTELNDFLEPLAESDFSEFIPPAAAMESEEQVVTLPKNLYFSQIIKRIAKRTRKNLRNAPTLFLFIQLQYLMNHLAVLFFQDAAVIDDETSPLNAAINDVKYSTAVPAETSTRSRQRELLKTDELIFKLSINAKSRIEDSAPKKTQATTFKKVLNDSFTYSNTSDLKPCPRKKDPTKSSYTDAINQLNLPFFKVKKTANGVRPKPQPARFVPALTKEQLTLQKNLRYPDYTNYRIADVYGPKPIAPAVNPAENLRYADYSLWATAPATAKPVQTNQQTLRYADYSVYAHAWNQNPAIEKSIDNNLIYPDFSNYCRYH